MHDDTTNNLLLSDLSQTDLLPLRARMTTVDLPAGTLLHEAGAALAHVYFPTTAIISLTTTLRAGTAAEVAAVGNEGLVGVCAFLGGGPALGNALVQSAGSALRVPATALREAARQSPALTQKLMAYTQGLLAHMAQTSACLRHHRVDQQLCRWLLLHLDRMPGNVLAATHDGIAQLLGVRREGVTNGAISLQRAGVIRYTRGRIELRDRAGLEARCCECYGAVRQALRRPQPVRDSGMLREHRA
jgi:CRP-like cAMP-binding protein